MSRVLWLASWYPNKISPFSGDFIQRQAIAVSRFWEVSLAFATKDSGDDHVPVFHQPNLNQQGLSLKEYVLYYPKSDRQIPYWAAIHSVSQYLKQHLLLLRKLREKGELPEIVHVQVAMKAGLIAYYLKKRYGIPFVITEHWSGYFDDGPDPLRNKSFLFRFLLKKIFREADYFLPVSENLREIVNRKVPSLPARIVPNVVDISLFNGQDRREPGRFRFIHVSSLHPLKNVEGIISVFEKLIASGSDAELVIVGPAQKQMINIAAEKPLLKNRLLFTGEVSYAQVAQEMKKSSAFILFSRIENLPCVVLESLCCGIPVISSKIGGLASVIDETNGILIGPGDEPALLDAMKKMMAEYNRYDKKRISDNAQGLYNYEVVGQQIADVYKEVLEKSDHR